MTFKPMPKKRSKQPVMSKKRTRQLVTPKKKSKLVVLKKRSKQPLAQPEVKRVCAWCGVEIQSNKRLCKLHLDHQREKMAEYRADRKKKGLCARCNNSARRLPNGKVSTLCEICREHVRELERASRESKK